MNKVQAIAALAVAESKGFQALRGGLGLADGEYNFTTPNSEDIFGIKEVKSNKDGKQYALTMVAGTVKDANGIATPFGLGDKDKQMVVTVDQWNAIEPNQSYKITVKGGRVSSFALVSEEVLETA